MKKVKIIVAVLLCLAFVMPLLLACSKNENNDQTDAGNPVNNTDAVPGGSESAEEKDPDAPDLPVVDMGGKTFTFLTANWGDTSPNLSKDIGGGRTDRRPH